MTVKGSWEYSSRWWVSATKYITYTHDGVTYEIPWRRLFIGPGAENRAEKWVSQ